MGFGVVLGLGLGSRPGISSWCPRPEPVFRVLREGSVRSGIQFKLYDPKRSTLFTVEPKGAARSQLFQLYMHDSMP